MLKLTTAPRVPSDNGAAKRQQQKKQLADAQDAIAAIRARFSLEAQLGKVDGCEAELRLLFDEAKSSGSIAAAVQVVDKRLKAIEIGSKLAQVGGYRQPHIPAQSDERGRWSITYVFQGAGKVEEIRLAEPLDRRAVEQAMAWPVGTRSQLDTDVPHTPLEPGTSVAISPEVDADLIERLVYRTTADEQPED